jgi:hypothetical protein
MLEMLSHCIVIQQHQLQLVLVVCILATANTAKLLKAEQWCDVESTIRAIQVATALGMLRNALLQY